jgi:hypothetical protein
MSGRLAAPLAKPPQLIKRQIVTGRVEERVKKSAAVSGREDEAISVRPMRVPRIVAEESIPQHVGNGRRAERQAGVSGSRFLDHVDGEHAKRVNAQPIKVAHFQIIPAPQTPLFPNSSISSRCLGVSFPGTVTMTRAT